MNKNMHVVIWRGGSDTVVDIEISAAQGEAPLVKRTINLVSFFEPTDPDETAIADRLHARCEQWLDRHVNLKLYCERALKWIGETSNGTQIQLKEINTTRIAWQYTWNHQLRTADHTFSEYNRCIDWVCSAGLTEAAQEDIVKEVESSIKHRILYSSPEYQRQVKLLAKFVASLPSREQQWQPATGTSVAAFREAAGAFSVAHRLVR